jgi:hypothetical protein
MTRTVPWHTRRIYIEMSDGLRSRRKRSADNGEGEAEGGQAAVGSSAKRPKPDAADTASAYAAAIKLVRKGEFPAWCSECLIECMQSPLQRWCLLGWGVIVSVGVGVYG